MDLSGVSANGAASAVMAQQQIYQQGEVQVNMLKKAIDTQTEGAMALIENIPSAPSNPRAGLPDNLGNHVNTTA